MSSILSDSFNNGGQSEAERGGARGSTSFQPVDSASDLDTSPGRITSLVAKGKEKMKNALKEVEERSRREGPWNISSKAMLQFQRDSRLLLFLEYSALERSNPGKEKFSALIISPDYSHFRNHKIILSETGNWDVKWAQTGESVFASYHPSKFCFDLIIVHHDLPGIDGPTVTRICRDLGVRSLIFWVVAAEEKATIQTRGHLGVKFKPTHDAEAMLEAISEGEIHGYVRDELNKMISIVKNIQRAIGITEYTSAHRLSEMISSI